MLPILALTTLVSGFCLPLQGDAVPDSQKASSTQPASRPSTQPVREVAPDKERIEVAKWGKDAPGRAVMVNRQTGESFKFKPITTAPYGSAAKLSKRIRDKDIVIGLVVGDQAFAYPINMLGGPQREIINEDYAGVAFCVNW